ncbi:MAG TPA: flagellar basal body P-ring protein FlgI, partial [Tepidisphaeraceae bacterium]|nr:flagellar basal body P-ring protein FlgI [Tepidisphaeraceae bacterium]
MRTWTFNLLRLRPIALTLALTGVGVGCTKPAIQPNTIPPRYTALPAREVPDYLRGTILQIADLAETQPKLISGFGLVVNLEGTGDSAAPNPVREYMLKQMTKHGFGSTNLPGYERLSPDRVLRDPRTTIVRVDGFVPPGARRGDRIDVQVSALPNNNTSSLARGILYLCDIKLRGANPMLPNDTSINPDGAAGGPIFVNPSYSLSGVSPDEPNAKLSLRRGIVLGGGMLRTERPLMLRVRTPSWGTAREIECRIDLHFQDSNAAQARDDGIVSVRVPARYGDDWEHFAGVVMHTYMNSSSEFAAIMARRLVDEAVKPDAPLSNITYALEALGPPAIPFIVTLLNHEDPDVQFAAARAAALQVDQSATVALQQIAQSPDHPIQLNA